MFEIGSLLIYDTTGVCKVLEIGVPCGLPVANKDRMYYKLAPVFGSGTIYIPVDTKVFMRKVITHEEAEALIRDQGGVAAGSVSKKTSYVVAGEKAVTLSQQGEEGVAVLATGDDVHQILYNLIENGIKYSARGGFVHTGVTVEGKMAVIRVTDHGVGIPDEDLEHVFDRFYRVDKARSRAVGGTGLGLSIVRDTVQRRGGSVEAAHRAEGPGSVFTVRLPLAEGGDKA